MMETVMCGKPTIITPFQTEQEGNGRRLEQLGCGRVILLSKERFKLVEARWNLDTYSFFIQNRYDLKPEELLGEVDRILNNHEYTHKAKRLQSKIKEYRGTKKALELIEKLSL